MPEISIIVDRLRGALLVEDNADFDRNAIAELTAQFGANQETGCARPIAVIKPSPASPAEQAADVCVRIAGYYHDSLCEGPGRRSSVLFQFCPLRCKGCWTPNLHDINGGSVVTVKQLAADLMDARFERDGVSILGGEPFAQPDALFTLVCELRLRGCSHIVCYSGYTLDHLHEKAASQSAIKKVLDDINILIDGAFVESLASGAGAWTGSGNQRVIDMAATRAAGETVWY